MKGFLKATLFVLLFAGALALGIYCENSIDDSRWNNGCCDCGGVWEFKSAETYKTSKYWYQCEDCKNLMYLANPR